MNTATHTTEQPYSIRRYKEWHDRVRGATRAHPMAQRQIARMCVEAEDAGQNCSVWHQSALFHGHECNCYPCENAREVQS